MDPADLIRAFVAAYKAWDVMRWEHSNPSKYVAAAHLDDCRAALFAFVEMEEKSKP